MMEMIANNYRGAKIIVTGGAGFIGSHLSYRLVQSGAKVTVVDSMLSDYGGNLFNLRDIRERINLNISDIRDINGMSYLVKDADYIFNLAGQVSHIDSVIDPLTDLDINCRAQVTLLEACRNNNRNVRIIFTSTRQVYGKPHYLPVAEDHPLSPVDPQGINTMAGEWYHLLYDKLYGITSTILRLTNTYGPHQLIKHDRHGFTGSFIRRALLGETIEIYGDGTQQRDFNYIDDVIDALLAAGLSEKAKGQTINLGSPERFTLLNFVEILKKLTGCKSIIRPFPADKKKIDIGDYYADYSLARKLLGWQPRVSLEKGLKNTIEFYRHNLHQYLPVNITQRQGQAKQISSADNNG